MPNPRQIHGSTRVEIIWTVVPAIVLFIVLAFTIQGLFQVSAQPASNNTLEVEAVGHQWWWEFYYPQYKFTTADTMHIPAKTIVHVSLFSNNVIHSFWVPQLTGKTDVIPGHDNTKWFEADTAGQTYWGLCTEYCGTQHANMRFQVTVDTNDQFQTWVSAQQQAAVAPTDPLAQQGQKIFASTCTGCHGIVGVDLKGYDDPQQACNDPNKPCLVGPNLTHFGSRDLIAGGVLENNAAQCQPGPDLLQRCNLAKWLNDPQGIKPGNDMQIGQLSPDQINALVAYLESLK